MNRKVILILAVSLLSVALVFAFVIFAIQPKTLFANLQSEDVAYIEVTYGGYPPYQLAEEDQSRLINHLRQVKVLKTEHEWMEYEGAISRMFLLHMTNGSQISVSASSPLFIVDGTTYQCDDYDTCHAISQIYFSYADTIRAESEPVYEKLRLP